MVLIENPDDKDVKFLKDIINEHYELTNSVKAKTILVILIYI